jgi:Secretion system C-terminal sorting domain
MRMRTIVTLVLLLVPVFLLAAPITYSTRESFEYPQSDSLNGAGTATNGFGGPWVLDDGSSKYSPIYIDSMWSAVIGQTALPYGDLLYPMTNAGNHLTYSVPGNWAAGGRFSRPLDKMWPNATDKTYWASFIMDVEGLVPAAGYSQWEYYCVKLFEGASERLAIGKAGNSTVYTCGTGWAGDTDPAKSLVDFAHGPVWLVTEMFMSGDTSATIAAKVFMWVNPDPTASAPDTLYADVKNTFTLHQGFDRIAIEIGSGDSLYMNYDEIRLGTDWASVSLPLAPITGVAEQIVNTQPRQFTLNQNYPNPFNPNTKISYTLKNNGLVRLVVYDLLGREVAVLVNSVQTAGPHLVDFSGAKLTTGIYFYRLENSGTAITKKMILLK